MAASALSVDKLFSISGKVALVTGGGRGIGAMIASVSSYYTAQKQSNRFFTLAVLEQAFVANNAKVYIASRSLKSCERKAKELSDIGPGTCIPLAADLGSAEGCKALAAEFAERESALHVLVNNSGTSWGEPMETYPDEAWDKLWNLNVKSVFTLTRSLLPQLDAGSSKGDPARVINVGSIAGHMPQPVPTYAYDASKAAVHMLTRKLGSELADRRSEGGHGITVNAIAPGCVPSRMSAQLLTYASEEAISSAVPLGRLGTPEDMGGAALFLASRAGAWMTGSVVTVDGGTVAQPLAMEPKL